VTWWLRDEEIVVSFDTQGVESCPPDETSAVALARWRRDLLLLAVPQFLVLLGIIPSLNV
jgi:hypothetical protein